MRKEKLSGLELVKFGAAMLALSGMVVLFALGATNFYLWLRGA